MSDEFLGYRWDTRPPSVIVGSRWSRGAGFAGSGANPSSGLEYKNSTFGADTVYLTGREDMSDNYGDIEVPSMIMGNEEITKLGSIRTTGAPAFSPAGLSRVPIHTVYKYGVKKSFLKPDMEEPIRLAEFLAEGHDMVQNMAELKNPMPTASKVRTGALKAPSELDSRGWERFKKYVGAGKKSALDIVTKASYLNDELQVKGAIGAKHIVYMGDPEDELPDLSQLDQKALDSLLAKLQVAPHAKGRRTYINDGLLRENFLQMLDLRKQIVDRDVDPDEPGLSRTERDLRIRERSKRNVLAVFETASDRLQRHIGERSNIFEPRPYKYVRDPHMRQNQDGTDKYVLREEAERENMIKRFPRSVAIELHPESQGRRQRPQARVSWT